MFLLFGGLLGGFGSVVTPQAASAVTPAPTRTTPVGTYVWFSTAAHTFGLGALVQNTENPANLVNEGSVAFTVTQGPNQIGAGVSGPVKVVGGVVGFAQADYTLPAATPVGTYTINATFTDSVNPPNYMSSSGTASLVVAPPRTSTSTTVSSSVKPSVLDQPVTFTATVTPASGAGTPTGAVGFLDKGSPIGTGSLSGGRASLTTSNLSAGNHAITAAYVGDANYAASTSGPLSQQVIGPAPGQVGHLLVAHTNAGLIYGLFSVNPTTGIGTYTQPAVKATGLVTGTGIVRVTLGSTQIAASGNNLALAGRLSSGVNQFVETAPLHAIGTFSLS